MGEEKLQLIPEMQKIIILWEKKNSMKLHANKLHNLEEINFPCHTIFQN